MQTIKNDEILDYCKNGNNDLAAAVAYSYSGGTGYTSVPTMTFSGGSGTGAAAAAIIENGRLVGATITNPGTGYSGTPTISFSGGGSTGAAATAVIEGEELVGIIITNSGNDRKLTLTDATQYASGDSRAAVNVGVSDKFGNYAESQIGVSPDNVVIDVVGEGLNPSDGIDAMATVVSAKGKNKDGSALNIGKSSNSGTFTMQK